VAAPTAVALKNLAGETERNILWASRGSPWTTPSPGFEAEASSCKPPPGLERLACFTTDQKRIDAIRFVQARTSENDFIFVGAGRHDKVYISDVAFYFLAKRRSATKWDALIVGVQTRKEFQQQIISDLQEKKTRYIVIETDWDAFQEPNGSAVSSGVTLLDDYIAAHYRPVARFDTVKVLEETEQ